MSLVESLLTAILRIEGDALVLHVGEKPYVVTSSSAMNAFRGPLVWGQVELSTRPLAIEAVTAMLDQLLSNEQRRVLDEMGAVENLLPATEDRPPFSVIAARGGDDIWIEVRPVRPKPIEEAPSESQTIAGPDNQKVGENAPPAAEQPAPAAVDVPSHVPVGAHTVAPATVEVPVEAMVIADTPASAVVEISIDSMGIADTPASVAVEVPVDAMVIAHTRVPSVEVPIEAPVVAVTPAFAAVEVPTETALSSETPAARATDARVEAPPRAETAAPAVMDVPIEVALDAETPSSPAMDVPIEVALDAETPAPGAMNVPVEVGLEAGTPAPPTMDVPVDVALDAETPAPRAMDVAVEVALEAGTPAPQAIALPTEMPLIAKPLASFSVDVPAEARLVDEPPAPVADEEPPFEIVNEEEQALPDEAEVTELLSSAGLLESISFESEATAEPQPVTIAVGGDRAASVAEPERTENVHDEPARDEPTVPLEPARLPPGNVEEPSSAVIVPLARTLRDTTGVHAVTPAPTLDRLLKIAAARGASGLYLVAHSAPVVRVEGEMQQIGDEDLLAAQDIEAFALHLAPEPSGEAVSSGATPEWFCELPELGRVRCLRFEEHRGPGLIVRMLPPRAISAEQLGLSREIQALCAQPDGLVLVAGPRASGKSTLIAAFVDLVNRTRSDHVVTIERQITFVHTPRRSFVSQREVRGEAEEIASAVRAALREDPDVLVVEDLRSPEITAAAIEAAESGRLVLAGLRAPGTVHAVQRLIEQFAPERRRQIESSLAATLRGVVAKVLLRKRGGGRVAARELLLNTAVAASLIAEGKAFQLPAAIESGRKLGSAALNDTLAGLIRDGIVDSGEAWRRAWDRDGLLTALKREGIDTSFVERLA